MPSLRLLLKTSLQSIDTLKENCWRVSSVCTSPKDISCWPISRSFLAGLSQENEQRRKMGCPHADLLDPKLCLDRALPDTRTEKVQEKKFFFSNQPLPPHTRPSVSCYTADLSATALWDWSYSAPPLTASPQSPLHPS